jgi:MFS family permease
MSVQEAADHKEPGLTTVVAASAAGTAFEWYDFFIFGSLATLIARHFYAGVSEATGFILALITFGVGFFVRPLGALAFGWFGDQKGRKGAFLVTITMMGVATVLIGVLPTYAQAGVIAPILLILMRVAQGFALGGEYGGAATYVAEHAPIHRRGELTGWIQTSAAFGLIGALAVILGTRTIVGEEAFQEWGWRIPFLLSAGLLAVSLWVRMKLGESPAFKRIEAEGAKTTAPFSESFLRWRNLKLVLIALFAIMIAQGAVWYASFFYSQFFLERVLKVAPATVNLLMIAATVVSAFLYVFFGWVSDRIGRKPVMLFGMILATVAFFPAFKMMTSAANPDLAAAQRNAPVVVAADPGACSLQFDPVGKARFTSSCDIAKSVLANAGVPYTNEAAPAGANASIRVGDQTVVIPEGAAMDPAALKATRTQIDARVRAALSSAGYPTAADPAKINLPLLFGLLLIFVVGATALYGPQAATLVELFPTRIRYTAMSLPYNIGTGWIGGFLPATSFAMVAATGDLYFGLWYPVVVTAIAITVCFFFLPETRGRDLETIET